MAAAIAVPGYAPHDIVKYIYMLYFAIKNNSLIKDKVVNINYLGKIYNINISKKVQVNYYYIRIDDTPPINMWIKQTQFNEYMLVFQDSGSYSKGNGENKYQIQIDPSIIDPSIIDTQIYKILKTTKNKEQPIENGSIDEKYTNIINILYLSNIFLNFEIEVKKLWYKINHGIFFSKLINTNYVIEHENCSIYIEKQSENILKILYYQNIYQIFFERSSVYGKDPLVNIIEIDNNNVFQNHHNDQVIIDDKFILNNIHILVNIIKIFSGIIPEPLSYNKLKFNVDTFKNINFVNEQEELKQDGGNNYFINKFSYLALLNLQNN